jgi:hypothetical protein
VAKQKKTNVSLPAKKPRTRGVTKAELKAELANHPTKDELKAELANYATKQDLAIMRAELVAELASKRDLIDMAERLRGEFRADLAQQIDTLRREFSEDLARNTNAIVDTLRRELSNDRAQQTNAILEDMRRIIGVVDDKYADLPARVTALEEQATLKSQ